MEELRGAPVARAIADRAAAEISRLKESNIIPRLAVLRVGGREDDLAYERSIVKRFSAVGADVRVTALNENATQNELEAAVREAADDASVHGILVFSPLPKRLDADRIRKLIPAEKDVDGMTDVSLASVFRGDENAFAPCTAQAVVEMLRYYGMGDLSGKRVAVIGRSTVVGKPLAMLLLKMNATVTVCHTKTLDAAAECRRADVVVACAGCARMVDDKYMSQGQTIIDVGINSDGDGICGDVDYAAAQRIVAAATPVPGGVGAVTTAVLLMHTVRNAGRQ